MIMHAELPFQVHAYLNNQQQDGDDDQVVKQEVFSGEYLPKCLRQWQEKSKREPRSKDEEGRLYNVFKMVTEI